MQGKGSTTKGRWGATKGSKHGNKMSGMLELSAPSVCVHDQRVGQQRRFPYMQAPGVDLTTPAIISKVNKLGFRLLFPQPSPKTHIPPKKAGSVYGFRKGGGVTGNLGG